MKQIFAKTLLACVVTLLALSFVTDLQAQQRQATAKVRAIKGSAQVSANGGGWTALKVNDVLKAGAMIRTGAESTVDLFLNNSVVRVTPETTMGLDKLMVTDTGAESVTETQLNLRSGRILGNVKKLASTSQYQIKTPNGVAGIRGTDFDITVTPLGNGQFKMVITSITGTIVGSGANSQGVIKTAIINTGETWTPEDDLPKILPPGDLTILQGIIEQLAHLEDSLTVETPTTIIRVEPTTSEFEGTTSPTGTP
jgi:hypothetical protein